jgi:hypothetical protein
MDIHSKLSCVVPSPVPIDPSNMPRISDCKTSVILISRLPFYDFLVPSFTHWSRTPRSIRCLTTSQKCLAETASHNSQRPPSNQPSRSPKSGPDAASDPSPLSKPLTNAQRDFLSSAVCPSFSATPLCCDRLSCVSSLLCLLSNISPATSKSSRRTSSYTHL